MTLPTAVMPPSYPPASQAKKKPARSAHRGDIQGLRAILMAQVLLFHAWTIGSPIGVDAFILVSAYLMTSSFVRRSEAGHMPFFIERWGNTFKRLLPPLVVTVLATLGASFLILPATRWYETTVQSFASLTYWENWRLVQVASDYYANDHGLSSPLQHLWSMSMQGQIFLLWPVLMSLCVLFARKMGVSIRKTVAVAFGLLMVGSLLWLILWAPQDGSVYFDTRARIWEFAFGSMVAAIAPRLKLGKRASYIVTTIALIVLLVFCLISIGTYPGPMAIFPMAATSALLLYVPNLKGNGTAKILNFAPLVALGDISYSVYLVHWPIFVLYLASTGQARLSFVEGILLIAISILVAWGLAKLVDDPLRKLPWANKSTRNKYLVVVISLAIGLAPVGAVYWWINTAAGRAEQAAADERAAALALQLENYKAIPETGLGSAEFPGSRILTEDRGEPNFYEAPIPGPLEGNHYSTWPDNCTEAFKEKIGGELDNCFSFGDQDTSAARVMVAGNSHAEQDLVAQITPLMSANNWSGYAVLRGWCPWTIPGIDRGEEDPAAAKACDDMNRGVLEQIDEQDIDYAFMVVTTTNTGPTKEELVPGIAELIKELTDRGVTVVGIRDNLRADFNLRGCSDQRPADKPYGGCLLKESVYFPDVDPTLELQQIPGFHMVDYRDLYCTDGVCPTIIGNIQVYMDFNHITGEYASTMAPAFSERVAESLGLLMLPENSE
ncbi:acyltransferase family protein [Actinomyces minihominis]|uniref:acyltransferase family protein n=1 Tax=Actinomyces minihominis TaxID=2002838 RepID=UPI0013EBFE71|nr:acyltransferase family protein [Actinomyces minihominis]